MPIVLSQDHMKKSDHMLFCLDKVVSLTES